MQTIAPPADHSWYDATEGQEPEYTGKFDCKVIDGDAAIYPAMWIPRGKDTGFGERGPGWRILIPRVGGPRKHDIRFYPVTKIKRWRPQPPPKGKRRKAA